MRWNQFSCIIRLKTFQTCRDLFCRICLEVWLPETGEFLGMVVCQGCVEAAQKKLMYRQMPSYADKMKIMFEEGDNHPDDDLRNARND